MNYVRFQKTCAEFGLDTKLMQLPLKATLLGLSSSVKSFETRPVFQAEIPAKKLCSMSSSEQLNVGCNPLPIPQLSLGYEYIFEGNLFLDLIRPKVLLLFKVVFILGNWHQLVPPQHVCRIN